MEKILAGQLYSTFETYKVQSINSNRVTAKDVLGFLDTIRDEHSLRIQKAGTSILGKEIHKISFGKGKTKILAWSQMHGDEPTATAAIFDIIQFLRGDDRFNELRNRITNELSIVFIPMLNPDGAELHRRTNGINVDLNRDALRTVTPEANLLWQEAGALQPEFAFNLHDQNSYYTAGRSGKTAAISLLAPPFDFEKSIDETRIKSMQVIVEIYNSLSHFIPGHIARYKDDFEPRAFGDNFAKKGISSILIESGFLRHDPNKDLIRKLNFISLLSAFNSIAGREYATLSPESYSDIPENESLLFDLLIKNCSIKINDTSFIVDIGINREKIFDAVSALFYFKSKIVEVGDLSIYRGIEEIDANGLIAVPAQIMDAQQLRIEEIASLDFKKILDGGYAILRVDERILINGWLNLPINLLPAYKNYTAIIAADEYANFLLTNGKETIYSVVNGFVYERGRLPNSILNGIVIS